jgi:hypothetical protein
MGDGVGEDVSGGEVDLDGVVGEVERDRRDGRENTGRRGEGEPGGGGLRVEYDGEIGRSVWLGEVLGQVGRDGLAWSGEDWERSGRVEKGRVDGDREGEGQSIVILVGDEDRDGERGGRWVGGRGGRVGFVGDSVVGHGGSAEHPLTFVPAQPRDRARIDLEVDDIRRINALPIQQHSLDSLVSNDVPAHVHHPSHVARQVEPRHDASGEGEGVAGDVEGELLAEVGKPGLSTRAEIDSEVCGEVGRWGGGVSVEVDDGGIEADPGWERLAVCEEGGVADRG